MGAPAPTAGAPSWWSWLSERAADFLDLVPRIYDLAHSAAVIAGEASRQGDETTAALAREAVPRIMALWRRADTLAGPVRRIAGAGTGLGTPWAALGMGAVTVVTVGVGVAWVWARYGAEAEIVRQLAEGVLTSAEAADLLAAAGRPPSMLGALGGLGALAITAAAVWALGRRR